MASGGPDEARAEPGKGAQASAFAVRFLNDDFTPMEFAVEVREGVFGKFRAEAAALMLETHRQGRGTSGLYAGRVEAEA